jgi:hypothetical protein
MRDNTNLFVINKEGVLEINKLEIRDIPEFREILFEDKGSEGDHDGRKKLYATKIFKFIHGYCKTTSIYRDLPEKKRMESCIDFAGLPSDWIPNKTVEKAMSKYVELLDLSALHLAYTNANRGVYGIGEDLELLNERRTAVRDRIRKTQNKLNVEEDEQVIQSLNERIEQNTNFLMDISSKIMAINNKLPDAFKTVEDLRKKLAEEETGVDKLYGGGDLGRREE